MYGEELKALIICKPRISAGVRSKLGTGLKVRMFLPQPQALLLRLHLYSVSSRLSILRQCSAVFRLLVTDVHDLPVAPKSDSPFVKDRDFLEFFMGMPCSKQGIAASQMVVYPSLHTCIRL